jgi:hypothetical protein
MRLVTGPHQPGPCDRGPGTYSCAKFLPPIRWDMHRVLLLALVAGGTANLAPPIAKTPSGEISQPELPAVRLTPRVHDGRVISTWSRVREQRPGEPVPGLELQVGKQEQVGKQGRRFAQLPTSGASTWPSGVKMDVPDVPITKKMADVPITKVKRSELILAAKTLLATKIAPKAKPTRYVDKPVTWTTLSQTSPNAVSSAAGTTGKVYTKPTVSTNQPINQPINQPNVFKVGGDMQRAASTGSSRFNRVFPGPTAQQLLLLALIPAYSVFWYCFGIQLRVTSGAAGRRAPRVPRKPRRMSQAGTAGLSPGSCFWVWVQGRPTWCWDTWCQVPRACQVRCSALPAKLVASVRLDEGVAGILPRSDLNSRTQTKVPIDQDRYGDSRMTVELTVSSLVGAAGRRRGAALSAVPAAGPAGGRRRRAGGAARSRSLPRPGARAGTGTWQASRAPVPALPAGPHHDGAPGRIATDGGRRGGPAAFAAGSDADPTERRRWHKRAAAATVGDPGGHKRSADAGPGGDAADRAGAFRRARAGADCVGPGVRHRLRGALPLTSPHTRLPRALSRTGPSPAR